jgi:pyrimidine/purine-5'-nucleotide nucleosidase
MEKRLEAFVRVGHGIVIFPGGVGTAEEILYLLGVLLHPDNQDLPMPLIMTGPPSSADYFEQIDEFIGATLGPKAQARYKIVIDDPERVGREMRDGLDEIRSFRRIHGDAYYFNWRLRIDHEFQKPFMATHETMRALSFSEEQPVHKLAANLRRVFSGIVSGNVREDTIAVIERDGPFEIGGAGRYMNLLDRLLEAFVAQGRMKLARHAYVPCYRVISD